LAALRAPAHRTAATTIIAAEIDNGLAMAAVYT
jgi:hypothetical protein